MNTKSTITNLVEIKKQHSQSKTIESLPSLVFCITMDLIGVLPFFIPGLGEIVDVVWAPVSATIFYKTFKGTTGTVGSIVNFVEELLPGLDFIPTFTIAYFYSKHRMKKNEKEQGD